jgi:uncharacterized protein with LGFP repeats
MNHEPFRNSRIGRDGNSDDVADYVDGLKSHGQQQQQQQFTSVVRTANALSPPDFTPDPGPIQVCPTVIRTPSSPTDSSNSFVSNDPSFVTASRKATSLTNLPRAA